MFQRSEPYAPRPIRFCEIIERDQWRPKHYAIVYRPIRRDAKKGPVPKRGQAPFWHALFGTRSIAPASGSSFFIRGRGWHDIVLCWWDNENEIFGRVFVKPIDRDDPWRAATNGEAACVWDLQVIWFKREAYVETILANPKGRMLKRTCRDD